MTSRAVRREAHSQISSLWLRICISLLVITHGIVGTFLWFTPRLTLPIESAAIASQQGEAYVASVNLTADAPYMLRADTNDHPDDSTLALFENDRALGPAHVLHSKIRELGKGRYSHWYGSLIFSSSDGSDPRTNGRIYSIKASSEVNLQWRILLFTFLALADAAFFLVFQEKVLTFLRTKALKLAALAGLSVLVAAGLSAFGALGVVTVAKSGPPEDAALAVHALQHACLGCLISLCMWAAGAGAIRLVLRDSRARLAHILIPAFPVGLVILALLTSISVVVPQGRIIALFLWAACIVPLRNWRPPSQELKAISIAAFGIVPFAIAFGIWLALLWHGPTATLSGSPSGDLTYYAGSIWSLADQPYPFVDLAYENGATRGYFNNLFPAVGAALLPLPGFDPFLFLLASGGTSYIVLSSVMLHLYISDREHRSLDTPEGWILVLSLLVAARYPYWVVESIPLVFVPALTISVWWMTERGQRDFRWSISAMVAGLSGSILSKVATAAVLVPLGATNVWGKLWKLPFHFRLTVLGIGSAFSAYCVAMLYHFLPLFLAAAPVGPESLQNPKWYFVCRDVAAVALMPLAWLIADRPVALAMSFGLTTFLIFAWVFQINFVSVVILLGLLIFTGPRKSTFARGLAFAAFAMSLPAAVLSDPAGPSSGIIWIVSLGAATLLAAYGAPTVRDTTSRLSFRISLAVAVMTLAVGGLGLVGISRGSIIVDAGWNADEHKLTPELREVWSAVSSLTPHGCLVFTDQVDETINVLGGWNTYALKGQRQIYLSSYYTTFELRNNETKLRQVLSINESVLRGSLRPSEVQTQHKYEQAFAVISTSRTVPPHWQKIFSNKRYAVFRIEPE